MIFEQLKKIILEQLPVHEEEITPETHFIEDLHADSLDITILIQIVSEEFDIAIPDDVVDRVSTVGEAAELLEEALGQRR